MSGSRIVGPALIYLGLLGFMLTIWMALIEAPSMGDDWNALNHIGFYLFMFHSRGFHFQDLLYCLVGH